MNYLTPPKGPSEYYTLNGRLEVTYPANFSAVCQFKSWNGGFFTDFDNTQLLPAVVSKKELGCLREHFLVNRLFPELSQT